MLDKLLAEITVIKRKKGLPTVIKIEGRTYILRHENQYQAGGNRGKKIQLHHPK
ncbi:hypothetical protein [Lederbergia lenta]|uniref:Uncharacterized protein n=1 Tax=Lederbergia lenta TaxID=1467 RepID=A0A2X4WM44_LEDLE|nr:hypothetical protein [Lederbergia lenta]MCM3109749.1 hypothetical protein [Lederbergia lenta]MEC2324501.1 hypothetical protein [Lederbergia lenta]SQI59772.1 Uncharacterised protein [Lederbergia lenta]